MGPTKTEGNCTPLTSGGMLMKNVFLRDKLKITVLSGDSKVGILVKLSMPAKATPKLRKSLAETSPIKTEMVSLTKPDVSSQDETQQVRNTVAYKTGAGEVGLGGIASRDKAQSRGG